MSTMIIPRPNPLVLLGEVYVWPARLGVELLDLIIAAVRRRREHVLAQSPAWLIAEQEIATNVQNLKTPIAFGLLLLLILSSTFFMANDYDQRLINWSINRIAQADELFSGTTAFYQTLGRDFMMMRARSVRPEPIIRRPLPLSILAKGLDAEMERAVTLGGPDRLGPIITFHLGNPQEVVRTKRLFAPPDFLYVVKIILSLLALFFTFDIITREKETGTLASTLANPVPRRSLLLGRWLGATASLQTTFLLATGLGLLYLTSVRGLTLSGIDWQRVGLLIGASMLYGSVFVTLGMFLSAWATRTKAAAGLALAAWLVLVLILPNLTALAAQRLKLLPTPAEHERALLRAAREIEDEAEAKHLSGFAVPGYGRLHKEVSPRVRAVARQLDDTYINRRLERDRLARQLARLSPVSSFVYVATDLAGTGTAEFEAYIEKLRRARNQYIELADRRDTEISLRLSSQEPPEQQQARLQAALQEFFAKTKRLQQQLHESLIEPRSPRQAIRDALPDLALLFGWNALLLLGAALQFNRYDVR